MLNDRPLIEEEVGVSEFLRLHASRMDSIRVGDHFPPRTSSGMITRVMDDLNIVTLLLTLRDKWGLYLRINNVEEAIYYWGA
jgi:hypothetical protein